MSPPESRWPARGTASRILRKRVRIWSGGKNRNRRPSRRKPRRKRRQGGRALRLRPLFRTRRRGKSTCRGRLRRFRWRKPPLLRRGRSEGSIFAGLAGGDAGGNVPSGPGPARDRARRRGSPRRMPEQSAVREKASSGGRLLNRRKYTSPWRSPGLRQRTVLCRRTGRRALCRLTFPRGRNRSRSRWIT